MSGINLKKCPFCGANGASVCTKSREPFPWEIMCVACGGSVGYYRTEEQAVAAWNRCPHDGHTCAECANCNAPNGIGQSWCTHHREMVNFDAEACCQLELKDERTTE